jgi:outer membrane protein OmpA-like peptidoglycan-associated protein
VDILQRYPQYYVKIDGHTDNVGEANYNQWLSERRAQRCYEYFISKGISPSRMAYKGYGQTNPIASNSSESGRKLNRRVEFNLYLP